jgi:hypothetical protein
MEHHTNQLYQVMPSFITINNKWYEVDALAEDMVFIEDTTKPVDNAGIKVGRYIKTDNRFISEYTPEGYMKVTIWSGNNNTKPTSYNNLQT